VSKSRQLRCRTFHFGSGFGRQAGATCVSLNAQPRQSSWAFKTLSGDNRSAMGSSLESAKQRRTTDHGAHHCTSQQQELAMTVDNLRGVCALGEMRLGGSVQVCWSDRPVRRYAHDPSRRHGCERRRRGGGRRRLKEAQKVLERTGSCE
jgi:hypothetical protein